MLAVVLSVVVFGGATEPVVAGAVLVGFAAGWAALAWASAARTDQPQRWAWLPAGVFGAIGLTYLAVRPGAGVMNASAWAWPVVLLGVAGWVVTRSRQELVSWSRRLVVYPIAARHGCCPRVGGGYENVREATDSAAHTMTGRAGQRRRPQAAHQLHGHRCADRRPRARARRAGRDDGRLDPARRGDDHAGLRLRPGRPRRQRAGLGPAGRPGHGRRPAHPAGQRPRPRPLRAGRPLLRARRT